MASEGDSQLPLIEILKRLPVKAIARFRSVCKGWKNLFRTQNFISQHSEYSDANKQFLLFIEHNYAPKPSFIRLLSENLEILEVLSFPDSFGDSWIILGCCNGLLCVQVDDDDDDDDDEDDDDYSRGPCSLWLWNPAIREVREISNDRSYCTFSNAGFGFSSLVNDYKIVRFFSQELGGKNPCDGVEVFSLTTGSWKDIEFGPIQKVQALFRDVSKFRGVSVGGYILWLVSTELVWFDVATEVFRVAPIATEDGIYPSALDVYQKKLACIYRKDPKTISVWVMDETFSESGKRFTPTQKFSIQEISHPGHVECIWRTEIVHLKPEVVPGGEGDLKCILRLFNLITKEEREFNRPAPCYWCECFSYEKTLVSVWRAQVEE